MVMHECWPVTDFSSFALPFFPSFFSVALSLSSQSGGQLHYQPWTRISIFTPGSEKITQELKKKKRKKKKLLIIIKKING